RMESCPTRGIDTATRPGGMSMLRKAPNKANLSQPQITRPQRVNVGWIRDSLCKTNPIPGRSKTGHRRATHSGSRGCRQARPTLDRVDQTDAEADGQTWRLCQNEPKLLLQLD